MQPITSAEEQRRKQMRDYFDRRRSLLPAATIAAGMLVIISALGISSILFGIIGVAAFVGGFLLMRRTQALVSDQAIDLGMRADLEAHDFVARAKRLLMNDDPTRDPVVLIGPAPDERAAGLITGERVGDDAIRRYTPQFVTVLLSSHDQLGVYQACLDHTTGNLANEMFLEVFYQDITAIVVSVSSQSLDMRATEAGLRSMQLTKQQIGVGLTRKKVSENLDRLKVRFKDDVIAGLLQRELVKTYRIDVSDGQRIEVPLSDGRPTRAANSLLDEEAGIGTAQAMANLRHYVRSKKEAFLHPAPGTT